ncbi:MAG: PAS domain S-box protein [Prolixibacteraceae bacterium]|nr:PAS domain S-box protein [Prolixibacteraceae bacterium]
MVEHTQEVFRMSDGVLLDILNMSINTRGYLLTGNDSILKDDEIAIPKLYQNISKLALLTTDNPEQQARIDSLKKLVDERFVLSKKMISDWKKIELYKNEKKEIIQLGKIGNEKIRSIISDFNLAEFNMLKQIKIENEKSAKNSEIIFLLLIVSILVIFGLIIISITNQKIRLKEMRAFTTAQKSLSKYSLSLIEASLDPLVTISNEGKITDMNEALVNITGISREEFTGTDFLNYFTEPQKAREVYQEVFAKGSVANSPLTLRHKDGKLTDVSFNGSVYKDDQGNVLGAVVVARDTAEQKWAMELQIANKELAFQNDEKEKRAEELQIANKELAFQNKEKEKRADELQIANKELAFQNDEKEKRADELSLANKELVFQNKEKEKRAKELIITDNELEYQTREKEKSEFANLELEAFSNSLKLASQYSLSLIEASLDPLVTISGKGKIMDMNEALANITGLTRTELIGTDFLNYFTEPQKAREVYQQVFAKGSVADSPLTICHKDGKLTDVLFNGSVYKDDLGEVLGAVIVARDVTAQKLLSQYSLSLIEASLDPLVTINIEGKITDVNEATVNITGLEREKLKGTDFFDYFTEPEKARNVYREVFAKGSVIDSPLTLRHQNGKLTDVLFNGSVYTDDHENVLGVVIVARDVTEQKRAATELTEAIVFAEMATLIAEEAKSKAESATKIAEDAVKAKQQFLSNMSHEIRTPMNAIIGFTKVVLKTDLSVKQKEYLQAIKLSGDALIVLINDILDLAKVDAGKMTFEQAPFKMALSISAMLHLFEPKIQEKNLKLIKEYDHRIPEVLLGDPVRLHQIILNLVSNAVKFTTRGKITVSVNLVDENDDKVTIEFIVSDTGIGIPESKIEKIFENFQQASSGTTRLYGGTGLGLAIVKQLVEAQDGSISVSSKINEGSSFSFKLSFQKTGSKVESDIELIELNNEAINIDVLVVEDIALNQLLMRTLLDDFGFGCDIADNGKIAIEKMRIKQYDVILMDLQMPEMNGFEATDYIRNLMNCDIPIIALTADVTTVDLAKCKSVGMNDYIAKPVDERLLYTKIISLVKKTSLVIDPEVSIVDKAMHIKCTNLEYLNIRTKSNKLLMMEMISLYLKQTPPLIISMKQGLREKDWNLLYSAVHKMIPSFSIMGINSDFEDMAKKVQEYASNQQHSEGIPEMVLQLEEVCEQACVELTEEYDTFKTNKL